MFKIFIPLIFILNYSFAQREVMNESTPTFKVSVKNTKLKFCGNYAGKLAFTVDGKAPTQSPDKTLFTVVLINVNTSGLNKRSYSVNKFMRLPYESLNLDRAILNTIEIDGLSGYEISDQGFSKSSGKKEQVYLVMLYIDSGYYLLIGTATEDFDKNLTVFKTITKTFTQK